MSAVRSPPVGPGAALRKGTGLWRVAAEPGYPSRSHSFVRSTSPTEPGVEGRNDQESPPPSPRPKRPPGAGTGQEISSDRCRSCGESCA